MSYTSVGTIVAAGSTGNEVVTGLGFTPCAVFLFWNPGITTEDAFAANCHLGIGCFDGTNQWAECQYEQDAANPPTISSHESSIFCLNSEGKGDASMVSLDTDGFTFNWGTAPDAGQIVYYIAFNDDMYFAFCDSFTLSAYPGSSIYGGIPFGQPTSLLIATGENLGGAQSRMGIGMAAQYGPESAPGGSIQNYMSTSMFIVVTGKFGRGIAPFAVQSNDGRIAVIPALTIIAPGDQFFTLTSWDTDGFTIDAQATATPRSSPAKFLALRLKEPTVDDQRSDLINGVTSSSPWPTPTLNPMSGIFLEAQVSQGTGDTGMTVGAVDDAFNQRSCWAGETNVASGNSVAQSYSSSTDVIARHLAATPSTDTLSQVTNWGTAEFTTTDDVATTSSTYLALLWGYVTFAVGISQIYRVLRVRRR